MNGKRRNDIMTNALGALNQRNEYSFDEGGSDFSKDDSEKEEMDEIRRVANDR